MKIAIYVRVSKKEQNLKNQIIDLERYAKAYGWEYDIYREKESTRKTRPIKQELINKLRRKEYDGVAVWKIDRWARGHTEFILNMEEFRARGIKFISLNDGIDTTIDSPYKRFFQRIMSSVAELERDVLRERTIIGLNRARAEGKILGRPRKTPPVKSKKSTRKKPAFPPY